MTFLHRLLVVKFELSNAPFEMLTIYIPDVIEVHKLEQFFECWHQLQFIESSEIIVLRDLNVPNFIKICESVRKTVTLMMGYFWCPPISEYIELLLRT